MCWGSNTTGQLGVPLAQTGRSSFPVKVDVGGKATAIAAGGAHTCAVLETGAVKCWGANDQGQLGRGTLEAIGAVDNVSVPKDNVALWTKAEVVTAGAAFTCVGTFGAVVDGLGFRRFFCWGASRFRQCGIDMNNAPVVLPSLVTTGGKGVVPELAGFGISAGDEFACAGTYVPFPSGSFASGITCWGSQTAGQLGQPATNGFSASPIFPSADADGGTAPGILGVLKPGLVASGAGHTCARIEQGANSPLHCWGNNTRGQTGAAVVGVRPLAPVPNFDTSGVTQLAAGGANTCVIVNGQVQCIGSNETGQLGRGGVDVKSNPVFADVSSLPPSASALAVGANHACAVLGTVAGQKGPIACWGQNQSGQLGDGLDIDVGYPDAPALLKRIRAAPVRVVLPK
jgi:alpha-tubulin suppressor-like RCC1 family protein